MYGECDDKVFFIPAAKRALLSSKMKLVSERKVTRRAETILVTDNSHFEGPKLLLVR